MSNVLLSVENLHLSISTSETQKKILNGIHFQIEKGKIHSLVGESGSGKSMTSLAITKLIPSTIATYEQGNVFFKSTNLLELDPLSLQKIRGKDISYVFQEPFVSLNPIQKIKFQLIESFLKHNLGSKQEAISKAENLLDELGITDVKMRMEMYPSEMSGGMLQRICIAMALMSDPEILIADEPTSAIDITLQIQIIDLIQKIQEKTKLGILFISHDIGLVSYISDTISILKNGEVVESGSIDSVLESPQKEYTKMLIHTNLELAK